MWDIHVLRNIHNADVITAAAGGSCRRAACSSICALSLGRVQRADRLAPQRVVFLVCVYFFFVAVDSLEPLFGFDDDERKIPYQNVTLTHYGTHTARTGVRLPARRSTATAR